MFPVAEVEFHVDGDAQHVVRINNPSIVVFVGPNNSGKSLVLREISESLSNTRSSRAIVKSITLSRPTDESVRRGWERIARKAGIEVDGPDDQEVRVYLGDESLNTEKREWIAMLRDRARTSGDYRRLLLPTVLLDGSARLKLANRQQTGTLTTPSNSLARLLIDDEARERLREVLYEAFRQYFVIDASIVPGMACPKFSSVEPTLELERSFTNDAIRFMQSATSIEKMSDGVRAFTGILVELFAGDPAVVIVDEPEAFLHPSLSFLLGREICKPPADEHAKKNVFVATHDASFLMGAIASGARVDVVRLNRSNTRSTVTHLHADTLRKLVRNPLLRSVGAMQALFYNYVVVTEADVDRAFYDEINNRLVAARDPRGIPNCLFLRAQNKQSIPLIVDPLRAMGIPTAAILDVDVYEEGGKVWSQLCTAAGIDTATAQGLGLVRGHLKRALDSLGGSKPKTRGGIELLSGVDRRSADNLFDQLGDHGVFVVRHGEVENWLRGVAPVGLHGPEWLISTFEAIGEEPSDSRYVKPGVGDVWDFIGSICKWFMRDSRKGM